MAKMRRSGKATNNTVWTLLFTARSRQAKQKGKAESGNHDRLQNFAGTVVDGMAVLLEELLDSWFLSFDWENAMEWVVELAGLHKLFATPILVDLCCRVLACYSEVGGEHFQKQGDEP